MSLIPRRGAFFCTLAAVVRLSLPAVLGRALAFFFATFATGALAGTGVDAVGCRAGLDASSGIAAPEGSVAGFTAAASDTSGAARCGAVLSAFGTLSSALAALEPEPSAPIGGTGGVEPAGAELDGLELDGLELDGLELDGL